MGIHYDYKSTKSAAYGKASQEGEKTCWEKSKRIAKEGPKKEEDKATTLDASKPITLDFLTNPNKEWAQKKKMCLSLALRKI